MMMNKAPSVARSLSRISSPPQLQASRTFFGMFRATPQSPVTAEIQDTLDHAFQPSFLKVIDESDKFSAPTNAGSHFKVVIVSKDFEFTESDVGRREMVNSVLSKQLQRPLHQVQAVRTLALMTPSERDQIMSKYDNPHQWMAMVVES